jgi:EAL domain-containing protein (putative c-di-GMP-specific phosphodiesterase class I)
VQSRILVVDDDSIVLNTMLRILRRAGFKPVGVQGAHAARAALKAERWDLVIADQKLPDGLGLSLLEEVARTTPATGRVLVTGYLELNLAMKAVNGVAVAQVLEKPFSGEALLNTVRDAIAQTNQQGTSELEWNPRRPADRQALEELLRGAQLRLALQPIVTAFGGSTVGYEALIRSDHTVLDGPQRILELAARVGMMRQLSQVVLARATEWLFRIPPEQQLFINLHPLELADVGALLTRLEPLQDWSDRIVLEITGACHERWPHQLPGILRQLRNMGFSLALDDLGAGQSALALLAEAEPRFVKIDMSIVRDVHTDNRKRRLVELLCHFAGATGAQVVAEGVEVEDEAAVLQDVGVSLMQGYLFGRPSAELRAA